MVIVLSDIIHNLRRFYRERSRLGKVGSLELQNLNLEAAFAIAVSSGQFIFGGDGNPPRLWLSKFGFKVIPVIPISPALGRIRETVAIRETLEILS